MVGSINPPRYTGEQEPPAMSVGRPFCNLDPARILLENEAGIAMYDVFDRRRE